MTKNKKSTAWIYEKKHLAERYLSIIGHRIPVRDVPDAMEKPIFTTSEPAIYIKQDSYLTKGLEPHKARALRCGLFTHEMAHQQFTDFEYIEKVVKDLEVWEIPAFRLIQHITEDPAIANMIPTFVGERMVQASRYAIKLQYEKSMPIEDYESPFTQCINAMINFGDMGPIKGRFTSRLAKEKFHKVISYMQDIMMSGNPKERIDISLLVFDELRPLWEKEVNEISKKMKEEGYAETVEDAFAELGRGFSFGTGGGIVLDSEDIGYSADLSKGASSKTIFKKMEEEKARELEVSRIKTTEKEEEELLASGEEESDKYPEAGYGNDDAIIYYFDEPADLSTSGDYDPKEYELEKSAIDFFDHLIRTELEIGEAKEDEEESREVPEFKEIGEKYHARNYRCQNILVKIKSGEELSADHAYNKILKKNAGNIKKCYKRLSRLFAEESEEIVYRSSGKVSVDRIMTTTVTPKVFTKILAPKEKSDIAVTVLIDESGSMNGTRIERAKEAAINFAEIFGQLGIPTYILGFTADVHGYPEAIHRHYTTWDNKKEDRTRLTTIVASSNNFDGYSIRYSSKLLGLRKETHKILIVISDGQPACTAYSSGISGYSDTSDAIREARTKDQIVLGVAIGADQKILKEMYGNDFIFITTGEDLFSGIMNKFTDMVKKW